MQLTYTTSLTGLPALQYPFQCVVVFEHIGELQCCAEQSTYEAAASHSGYSRSCSSIDLVQQAAPSLTGALPHIRLFDR